MVSTLVSIYFNSPRLRHTVNFNFLEKVLGVVSPTHSVIDFLRKFFFHILLTDQFYRQPILLHEIVGNMCIEVICFPGCEDVNLEIMLRFLIKPFSYTTKKVRTKI